MDNASSCPEPNCNARVISADTLSGANNYPLPRGAYKVPKVLAEFVVQLDSESKIRLNEPAYEIKRIEKQVFLTQCRYIAPTDKIFIQGYIRKNIEYAVRECTTDSGISGFIRDTTVHIPIKAYTQVNFTNLPRVFPNLPPVIARYFDSKRKGKNIREADRGNIEIFNEPVFCELEWSAIFDADIDDKGIPIEGFNNEEEFQEFTDKSVVYLCLKLLQKQQVWSLEDKAGKCSARNDIKKSTKSYDTPLKSDWNFSINDFIQRK